MLKNVANKVDRVTFTCTMKPNEITISLNKKVPRVPYTFAVMQ